MASQRVLVTRAAHQAGKLSDQLRIAGFEPVEVPVLEIVPPESYDLLDAALRQVRNYNWLIFTSANTIPVVRARTMDIGINFIDVSPKIAAIGAATAEAVERTLNLKVSLKAKEYVAESLVAELAPLIFGQRILLARAAIARDVIPDALRAAGATVDVVDAYRNIMPNAAPGLLRSALKQRVDAATFTSSSSVTHLADAARMANIGFPLSGVPAISIGPVTTSTLRDHRWEPVAEAYPSDIPSLVTAVRRFFDRT